MSPKPAGTLGALLRLYVDVALWRRGPADVPGVPLLLGATLAAYLALSMLLSMLLGLRGNWPGELVFDAAFTLGWPWLLLRAAGRRERFVQTACALFGFQLILAPLAVGVQALLPAQAQPGDPQLFALQLAALALQTWIIAAVAHIVRDAFEWPLAAGVALAVFLLVVEVLLMRVLFQVDGA
ncbi:MAG: hypothetical protein IT480_05960 [Gammaproteobacteria bacterium]|nr:hypothetical protein [Gammaproteobacteria bacterium]